MAGGSSSSSSQSKSKGKKKKGSSAHSSAASSSAASSSAPVSHVRSHHPSRQEGRTKRVKKPPQNLSQDLKLDLRQACRKAALRAEASWDKHNNADHKHRVLGLEDLMLVNGSGNSQRNEYGKRSRSASSSFDATPQEQDPRAATSTAAAATRQGGLPEDDHSASSFLSHERAIQRGLTRGEYEHNERNSDLDSIDELLSIDYELTTVSDSHISDSRRKDRHKLLVWGGWRKIGKDKEDQEESNRLDRRRRKKRDQQSRSAGGSLMSGFKKSSNKTSQHRLKRAKEAWMCGVCAKSFPTMEAAERHEDYHLKEVVLDLGWTDDSAAAAAADVDGDVNGTPPAVTPKSGFSSVPASFFEAPPSPVRNGKNKNPATTPFVTPATKAVQPRPDRIISSRKPPPSPAKRPIATENTLPRVSFHHDLIASPPPLRMRDAPDKKRASGNGIGEPAMASSSSMMRSIAEDQTMQFDNRGPRFPSESSNLSHPAQILDADRDVHADYVVLADEALVDVCSKAEPWIMTPFEVEARSRLRYLAMDKEYYDRLADRALDRRRDGDYARFRAEGKNIMSKVQNKFVDAYQLIKQGGDDDKMQPHDHYVAKNKRKQTQSDENAGDIHGNLSHTDDTIYINVVVKNSIQLVRHELERLAKQRWEDSHKMSKEEEPNADGSDHDSHDHADARRKRHARQQEFFQKFRAAAQGHLVNLAGIALASDFTPRRIAVQLSNDLYRQLTPRLKRRGVTVATEIEYRVGPYFVLAVNVKQIDWGRVTKNAYRGVIARRRKWRKDAQAAAAAAEKGEDGEEDDKGPGVVILFCKRILLLARMTRHEILAQFLAWMYFCHWTIHLPICAFLYHFCCGSAFRTYFLASVTDDIFSYVEEKGMEMDIGVRTASSQAGAMLSALREIRDGRGQKKKTDDTKSAQGSSKPIIGPLLGPAIAADKGEAPPPPDGFEMPENLEFVCLDIELPVGFRRLRWGLLHSKSTFLSEALFRVESNYDNINMGTWSVHDDHLGSPTLPDGVEESEFLGAEKTNSYLMPKSAFVKANTCTETMFIDVYNDYCLCIRKKALTPEVPYGSTFVAWTKIVLVNTGNSTCAMTASVEAEFPNGEPMISRQIRGGMRQGVTETFVTMGETITKYADEFP